MVFVDFQPRATEPFLFKATLDGVLYDVLVTFNLFGQRYFLNIHDQDGNLIVCEPVVGSPTPKQLAAVPASAGVSSMTWASTDGGRVSFVMTLPSIVTVGSTINVSGAHNDGTAGDGAVNGAFVIDQWIDSQHFSALLTAPSGAVGTVSGSVVINFSSYSMTWNHGIVVATTDGPVAPLMFELGDVVSLVVAGAVPTGYNGRHLCVVTGPSEFRFQLPTDPGGSASTPGSFSPDINLVQSYFNSSSLVYRSEAQRFEISP